MPANPLAWLSVLPALPMMPGLPVMPRLPELPLMPALLPLAMLVALAVDRLLGEPPVKLHPVVGMGRYLGLWSEWLTRLAPRPADACIRARNCGISERS